MARILQIAVMVGAGLLLFLAAILNAGKEVELQPWLFSEPRPMSLGLVLILSVLAGVLVTVVITLIDRVQLKRENLRLKQEMAKNRRELASLREIVTQERDSE